MRQAAVEALAAFPAAALLPALESALRDGDDAGLRNASMEIYVRLGEVASGLSSACSATPTRRCASSPR